MDRCLSWKKCAGFTLLEMLLALTLGVMVLVVIVQALVIETGNARKLGQILRERLVSQRALALIASEVQRAEIMTRSAPSEEPAGCDLAGMQVLLNLQVPEGSIIYSLNPKPSSIWRGAALTRCGPSYGLDGAVHPATTKHSVLVDALAGEMLATQFEGSGVVLRLERAFGNKGERESKLIEDRKIASNGSSVK